MIVKGAISKQPMRLQSQCFIIWWAQVKPAARPQHGGTFAYKDQSTRITPLLAQDHGACWQHEFVQPNIHNTTVTSGNLSLYGKGLAVNKKNVDAIIIIKHSTCSSEGAVCLGDHILFRILTYFNVFLFSLHYKLFRFHFISVVYHVIQFQ